MAEEGKKSDLPNASSTFVVVSSKYLMILKTRCSD